LYRDLHHVSHVIGEENLIEKQNTRNFFFQGKFYNKK